MMMILGIYGDFLKFSWSRRSFEMPGAPCEWNLLVPSLAGQTLCPEMLMNHDQSCAFFFHGHSVPDHSTKLQLLMIDILTSMLL
jgi:hypothetical protein